MGKYAAAAIPAALSAVSFATGNVALGIQFAASASLSLVAAALTEDQTPEPQAGGQSNTLSTDPTQPRMFGVGRYRTAGSLVYAQVGDVKTSGSNAGDKQNRFFDQVIALNDHWSEALDGIMVEGKLRTLADPMATKMGCSISEYDKNGNNLWVKFFDGRPGQTADQRLLEAAPTGDWTADHRLTGVSYIRLTGLYNEKVFKNGWPEVDPIVKGAKIYSVKKDTSAGGSGSHRLATPATWEWSENPAEIVDHLMRGFKASGKTLTGFQGTKPEWIDIGCSIAAINACNENVALAAGGTEKRYTCGGEFSVDTSNSDILQTLLAAMSGYLCHTGYSYRLFAGVAQTPVASITDDDILSSEAREFEPRLGLANLTNAVVAQYCEPDEGFNIVSAPVRWSSADEAEDANRRLPLSLQLDIVNSDTQAQRLAEIARRAARYQKRHRISLMPEFLRLEIGDWISWTSAARNYTNKTFRIDAMEVAPDLKVFLSLTEIDPAIYTWSVSDEVGRNGHNLSPGNPDDSVYPVFNVAPVTVVGGQGNRRVGFKATWDMATIDNPRIRAAIFRYRTAAGGGGDWEHAHVPDPDVGQLITTKHLAPGTVYNVGAAWRYRSGRRSDWSPDVTVTTDRLRGASPGIPSFALTASTWTTAKGRSKPGARPWIRAVFGAAPASARKIQIRYKETGDTDKPELATINVNDEDMVWRTSKGVIRNTTYSVGARYLYEDEDAGPWSDFQTITPGDTFDASDFPTPSYSLTALTTTGPRRGKKSPCFRVLVTAPTDPRVKGVVAQWKPSANSWTADSVNDRRLSLKDALRFKAVDDVFAGEDYDFRLCFTDENDNKGSWSSLSNQTAAGEDVAGPGTIPPDGVRAAFGDNRVYNSSFERLDGSSLPLGWTVSGSNWASSTNGTTGLTSMVRSATGNTGGYLEPVDLEPCMPGQTWRGVVSATKSGSSTVLVQVSFTDVPGNVISSASTELTGSGEQQAVARATAPSGARRVRLRVIVNSQTSGQVSVSSTALRRMQQDEDLDDDPIGRANNKPTKLATSKLNDLSSATVGSRQLSAIDTNALTARTKADAVINGDNDIIAATKIVGRRRLEQLDDDAIDASDKVGSLAIKTGAVTRLRGSVEIDGTGGDTIALVRTRANGARQGSVPINTGDLAAYAVTADKIAANTITGGKIFAGTLTADLIKARGISALYSKQVLSPDNIQVNATKDMISYLLKGFRSLFGKNVIALIEVTGNIGSTKVVAYDADRLAKCKTKCGIYVNGSYVSPQRNFSAGPGPNPFQLQDRAVIQGDLGTDLDVRFRAVNAATADNSAQTFSNLLLTIIIWRV